MSPRPTDSYFPRILIRPRLASTQPVTSLDQVNPALSQSSRDFSDAMQQMVIEAERAMYSIQGSVPVSIRDYHSLVGKGQGLVDDLAICQRAVNAIGNNGGGYLFLPKGDYFFAGALLHSFDNVVIFGEGENTVIHQQTANVVTFGPGVTTGTTTGVGLRDLLIDVAAGALSQAVLFRRCERFFVDRVVLTSSGTYLTGFLFQACVGGTVTNCESTSATSADLGISSSGANHPDNILVMHNNFDLYLYTATAAGSNIIRDNIPIAIPTLTINGAAQTITDNQLFGVPDRFVRIQGTAGGAAETVDTVEVTYEGDLRTFIFDTTNLVTFLDVSTTGVNLHLAGDFVPNAGGDQDTLTVFCDGTNWIEVARSDN